MKQIPNIITAIRIIGTIALLIVKPLSGLFFMIYLICGLSDIFDGYIARKMKVTSPFGAKLDSIADFLLIGTLLIILIPLLPWSGWMLLWIGVIATIRFLSLTVGFVRYHAIAFLHTYANKVTGLILFSSPIILGLFGMSVAVLVACGIASLSACEELLINITSKHLNRDRCSLFVINRKKM